MDSTTSVKYKSFKGAKYFRLRIMYSLLTMSPIEISDIRSTSLNVGVTPSEVCFLRLIEKITNGSKVYINQTGSMIRLTPGTVTNNYGESFEFECDTSRGISYYLEGLFPICLFGKESLNVVLTGCTDNQEDISIDCMKAVYQSIVEKIVVGDACDIQIKSKSLAPDNSGKVQIKIPIVKFIEPFTWTYSGKIKKIKGHCLTVNCNLSKKVIDETRVIFNNILNEVWIEKLSLNSHKKTPGLALSLWGETTEGFVVSYSESVYSLEDHIEDIVQNISTRFLEEVIYVSLILILEWLR